MKVSKRGFEWECGYGQHVLDKHDQNIKHVAIDNRPCISIAMTLDAHNIFYFSSSFNISK